MNQEQFDALLDYIDARIEEKIADAFGKDSLSETVRCTECRLDLKHLLIEKNQNDK